MAYELSAHWKEIRDGVAELVELCKVEIDNVAGSPGYEDDLAIRSFFGPTFDLYVSEYTEDSNLEFSDTGAWDIIFWAYNTETEDGTTVAIFRHVAPEVLEPWWIQDIADALRPQFAAMNQLNESH